MFTGEQVAGAAFKSRSLSSLLAIDPPRSANCCVCKADFVRSIGGSAGARSAQVAPRQCNLSRVPLAPGERF
jgi:hypothetical protein